MYFDTSLANKSKHSFAGKKHPVFVAVFGTLVETDGVPEGSRTELEKFVCYMYGKPSLQRCLSENAIDTDDDEDIRVASLLDIIYDNGDDDFEENSTAPSN